MAHLGRYIDDGPRALGSQKPLGDMLRQEEGGPDIQAHHRIKIIHRHIGEGLGAIGAGVIDQNIEGLGSADGGFCRGQIEHIQSQRRRLTALGADRCSRGFNLIGAARNQRDMRALISQRACRRQANTAPSAGNQRAAAIKPEGRGAR